MKLRAGGLLLASSALTILLIGICILLLQRASTAVEAGAVRPDCGSLATTNSPVKRSSSAIALTADGRLLLTVNPDSDSLSIIDLDNLPAVAEIGVGSDPRTVAVSDDGARAYVANRGSSSISVVDLNTRQLIGETAVGARPYGVVVSPDGRHLYVAEQGNDRLAVLDAVTLASVVSLPLADRPSGLAFSNDGQTLYISHLLSNTLTVLTPLPNRIFLPLVTNSTGSGVRSSVDVQTPGSEVQWPTSSLSLWSNSNLVQSVVIAPDGQRAYVPHTRANSSNRALTLDSTVFPIVSVVDLATNKHLVGQQFNLEILDPPAVGLPFDAALTPDCRELWVLNAASNDVTVIDLQARQRLAHIQVGDNPRGIVMSPDGSTAYVNNTLSGSVSVIDTTAYTTTAVLSVTTIPLDSVLLTGKRLFHSSDDPRMGKDQWMSCNSCHFDGENDGQTWFLGFAGPRNTSSLLGMSQTLPLRWSGEWDEAADSEFAIRMDSFGSGLVEGDMRCSLDPPDCINHAPHAGVSADLDALAAYINSLTVPLSPGHMEGQPLTPAEERGRALFNDPAVGCATCHTPPLYTDNLIHDVGTSTPDERIGPAFNTPSLRGVYDTAPYFHDGSAESLHDAVTRPSSGNEHDVTDKLNEAEIRDLIAYLLALPFQ